MRTTTRGCRTAHLRASSKSSVRWARELDRRHLVQGEGYQTTLIGKYLNGYARRDTETYMPLGWGQWLAELGGGGYYDYQMNENEGVFSYGSDEQDYYTDVLADKAKDYVQDAAGDSNPFFVYLAPLTPHDPFVPAPRHEDAHEDLEAPQPTSFGESDADDKSVCVICPG